MGIRRCDVLIKRENSLNIKLYSIKQCCETKQCEAIRMSHQACIFASKYGIPLSRAVHFPPDTNIKDPAFDSNIDGQFSIGAIVLGQFLHREHSVVHDLSVQKKKSHKII